MALPYKPTRTFVGVEGAASLGTSGPEALKTDTNEIVAMFDPLSVHGNATPGGIAIGNLATGEATATPTANKLVLFDVNGNLPGSIANAANVTTNINGHAITDILEADGATAKVATLAGSCMGNAATATTGPSASWGFFYPLADPYSGSGFSRDHSNAAGYYTVGPTGSSCDIIFSALDSLPSGVKVIRLNLYAWALNNGAANSDVITALSIGNYLNTNFSTKYSVFTCASATYAIKDYERNTVEVALDSSKRFKIYWHTVTATLSAHAGGAYLQGYLM
jgi:hypothetical protein